MTYRFLTLDARGTDSPQVAWYEVEGQRVMIAYADSQAGGASEAVEIAAIEAALGRTLAPSLEARIAALEALVLQLIEGGAK